MINWQSHRDAEWLKRFSAKIRDEPASQSHSVASDLKTRTSSIIQWFTKHEACSTDFARLRANTPSFVYIFGKHRPRQSILHSLQPQFPPLGCRHERDKVSTVVLTPKGRQCETNITQSWTSDDSRPVRVWPAVSRRLSPSARRSRLAASWRRPRRRPGDSVLTPQALSSRDAQQCEVTPLWQELISFIQTQCNRLYPGGAPGSNILITLICKIPTMRVFRWLVIWCERSLCVRWVDTGKAGTCSSKTLQKIIAVELSWVRAITNDSVCLSPRESQILRHRSLNSLACRRPVKALLSSFISNLLWMICSSHRLNYASFWGSGKGQCNFHQIFSMFAVIKSFLSPFL